MTYLVNPTVVALAIQAKCGNSVVALDEGLLAILDLLLPRVEDLMNVASLTYGETTDTFTFEAMVPCYDPRKPRHLLLSNGYLVNSEEAPITITDPNGSVLDADDFTVNLRYGTITVPSWVVGEYTVSYYAGFTASEADEETTPVTHSYFEDVPPWIVGVVTNLLTTHYRTIPLAPKIVDNVAYIELMNALYRDLKSRVYMRYQRPRANMLFPDYSVRADGMMV